jgi:hypothetical protein
MEQSEARRIFVGARVAAAQRLVETGRRFLDDPSDEQWFFFLSALGDISQLEASSVAAEAFAGVREDARRSRIAVVVRAVTGAYAKSRRGQLPGHTRHPS